LLRHLRNDWYGKGVPGWVTPLVTVLAAGFFAALALTGLAGLLTALDVPVLRLGLLLLLQSLFLFGATYALSRYSVPLRPFLALGAAVLVAGPVAMGERWRALGGGRRLVTVLALALVSLSWVRDLPLLADLLRNEGAGPRFRMEPTPTPGSRAMTAILLAIFLALLALGAPGRGRGLIALRDLTRTLFASRIVVPTVVVLALVAVLGRRYLDVTAYA